MKSFVFWILAIILVASSFSNGLYFDHTFYPYQLIVILLSLLVLVYTILTRDRLNFGKYSIVMLLPLILLISLFVTETPKGTIDEVLKWITYGCYFLLLYWSLQEERNRQLAVPVIYIGGFIIIGYSLLSYMQITPLTGAIVNDRLGGVFQYPNTFGIFSAFFVMLFLLVFVKNQLSLKMFLVYAIPAITFFTGLFLSESRGAMLVLLIVGIGTIFFLNVKEQVKFISYAILTGIISFIAFLLIDPENTFLSLLIWILATAIHVFLLLRITSMIEKIQFKNIKQSYISIGMFFLFILAGADLLFRGLLYKFINNVLNLSISLDTFFERFVIWKDALKAATESPILGYGGGAWRIIYTQFQSYPYQTNNLHNGYLEWLIGAGIIGLVVFIAVFGYLIYKVEKTKKILVLVPLSAILLHSLIDFNFSFGTIWLLIFWMLALGIKQEDQQHEFFEKYDWAISLVICIILIIPTIYIFQFIQANQHYENAVGTNNLTEQLIYLEKAVQYDSNDVQKLQGLAQTYSNLYLQTGNETFLEKLFETIEKIEELEPKNSIAHYVGAQLLKNTGQLEKAVEKAEKALTVDYFNTQLFEKSIQLNTDLAIKSGSVELAEQALVYFENLSNQYEEITNLIDADKMEIYNSRNFFVTDAAKYLAGLAAYITDDYNKTLQIVDSIEQENEDLNNKIAALKTAVYKRTNDNKAEEIIKQYENNTEFQTLLSELEDL